MAVAEAPMAPAPSAGKALAGFLLSGFLFALLGAMLPAWGYYRDPPEFITIGNCFLGLSVGLLNAGLFQALAASYSRAPAPAAALGGIYYGLGCLAVTLLVAGTF